MTISGIPGDIVKWAVEFALQQAIQNVPVWIDRARKGWRERPLLLPYTPSIHIPRVALVNREMERRAIRAAIADVPRSHVKYFYGPGGVGKTRLLEETQEIVKSLRLSLPLRWAGILDLYHIEHHSISDLQMAIVRSLDPDESFFTNYREACQQFEHHKAIGLRGDELGKEFATLNGTFREDYNLFSKMFRPVVAFDTFERINDEIDLIQKLTSDELLSLGNWLLDFCKNAPNSVFLLAGRQLPTPQMSSENNRNETGQFEEIAVGGLTAEDTRQLLGFFLQKEPKSKRGLLKNSYELRNLTNGMPVKLAMAVELVARGKMTIEKERLNELDEKHLINAFFSYEEPDNIPVFFLALARKGLTADLLHYLEPAWSIDECKQKLQSLRSRSLVKSRPGQEELFLHDELYELFDKYVPEYNDLKPWYESFIEYYRGQQNQSALDRVTWGRAALKLLYYALQHDSTQAFYENYVQWSEAAIAGYEIDLDMQLRDELLFYVRSAPNGKCAQTPGLTMDVVNLDSAVRWVKRYTFQARHRQAAELAEKIMALGPSPYCDWATACPETSFRISDNVRPKIKTLLVNADDLFWGHLLTYYGDVLTYLAGTPEERVFFFLDKARERLENSNPPSSHSWLRTRLLGRVYDRLGYLARTYGHYGIAVQRYRQALPYYEETGLLEELATTLNNLAFVLALLGESQQAKECADKAFAYRQQLGQRHPLALSYNTRGLIHALKDYERGRRECQQALNIFEEIDAPRGKGLAYNALGYILRRQGAAKIEKGDLSVAEECFKQAERFLKRSVEIFSSQVSEPIRLWEAHNEMGSLYYDWGDRLYRQGDETLAKEKLAQSIEHHEKSLDVFKDNRLPLQEADTCDDLAKAYAKMGKGDEAMVWLDKCSLLVPDEYDFTKGGQGKKAPAAGEVYWLIMGKIWLQKGIWALDVIQNTHIFKKRRDAVRYLMLSAACFHYFWPSAQNGNRWLEDIIYHIKSADLNIQGLKKIAKDLEVKYGLHLTFILDMLAY